MQIEINEIEYCKYNVNYEADADQISNKKTEVLSLFKKAPVPGFREGKTSIEVIKIHYKKQIEDALKRALAEEAFHTTVFEKNLKPLGPPSITSALLKDGKFTCQFSLNTKPEFELQQYKDFQIPKPATNLSVEQVVEKILENLRLQYGSQEPYQENDFVQINDNVIIDYECYENDVKLDNYCVEGELLVVGNSRLTGFDDNLYGMKIGDTREFILTIPTDAGTAVAGKALKFVVSLKLGSKNNPHPLNDDLAKKVEKNSLDELRQLATGIANNRVAMAEKSALISQTAANLNANHTFKLPDWIVLQEAIQIAATGQVDWNILSEEDRKNYLAVAEPNVRLAFILDKIRENEPETQLSDQEVFDLVKTHLKQHSQNPDEDLNKMMQNGYLNVLSARIRDEHTMDFVLKNSTIVE